MKRRQFLRTGSGVSTIGLTGFSALFSMATHAQTAAVWNKSAFATRTLADTVKALGGQAVAVESKDISLQAPEIAENGGEVRLTAQSAIPGTSQIALVIEKNPNALAALFDIPPGSDASITLNVKMGQSSNVYALARAGDRYFYAVRDVRVTLGGCGN